MDGIQKRKWENEGMYYEKLMTNVKIIIYNPN